ncbi:hypothetical protein [Halorubrum sp. DTA46]|uniref:hypothetical protein n=1 Tax=Halorubrum sp. DTA46 TaxID=3402162 RepID=UPI003AABD824
MLSAGNPYVLPSVLVAAGVYLAVTVLTDASVFLRIGVLAFIAGVVPIVLNRLFGGGTDASTPDAASLLSDEPSDEPTDESADEPTDA